jgi:hypothetical protein
MRICPGCDGILGVDCFNEQECIWISQQMQQQQEPIDNTDYESLHLLSYLLGMDTPWPLSIVLDKLITASQILLHKKDYDGPDYEEIGHAVKRGREILNLLTKVGIYENHRPGKE